MSSFRLLAQEPKLKEKYRKPKVMNYQEVDMKALHFGFTIGFNTSDFGVDNHADWILKDSLMADVPRLQPGFHVNIITDWRLGDYWSFRFLPGLIFTQRNLIYYDLNNQFVSDMKLESNLLDFPVLIKYKSKRINNYRPYVIAGANFRVDMAAKKKYDEDEQVFVKLKKFDYYWEIGYGVDFYNLYFKFSTELKLSIGLRDVLTNKPYAGKPQYVRVIDRLTSSLFILSFHFE
jgi:hypothetical protein